MTLAVIFLAGCSSTEQQYLNQSSALGSASSISFYSSIPTNWSYTAHPHYPELILPLPLEYTTFRKGAYHGDESQIIISLSNAKLDGINMGSPTIALSKLDTAAVDQTEYFYSICSHGVTHLRTNPLQKKILITREMINDQISIFEFEDWCNPQKKDQMGFPVFAYSKYLIVTSDAMYIAKTDFETFDENVQKLLQLIILNARLSDE
jgi:hypothetical protein